MYLSKLLPLFVCAAVACTPAMYGANQKSAKVRKIGTTTLSEAAARAQAPSFAGQTEGRPKSMLKQMPKPGHPSFSGGRENQGGNLMFAGYPVVGPTPSFPASTRWTPRILATRWDSWLNRPIRA